MISRFVPALLAAAALAYACGPRSSVGETAVRKTASGLRSLTGSLGVRLQDEVQLDFRVTNETARKVEVSFPSGLTHDFVVEDTIGRVIWRWSEGRIFTQAMQNRVLGLSDTLTFHAAWEPGQHRGAYVAIVALKSSTHPIEERVRFTIP